MLNKSTNSEQPSKNQSFSKCFPSLSHRPSDSMQKEKIIDLGILPHWTETLSVTDCSSGGRFFRKADGTKTTRAAATRSLRMPKVLSQRESYLAKYSENQKGTEFNYIWEITERVDSFKIRSQNKSSYGKNTKNTVNEQINLWKPLYSRNFSKKRILL